MLERTEVVDPPVEARRIGASIARRPLWAAWQRLTGNSLLRHNVLLFAANMATSALNYLYYPIVGKFLGKEALGILAPLGALAIIFLIPTQVVANIANKFAADLVAQGRVDQINYLFRRATRYALLAGFITAVVFALLSPGIAGFLRLPSAQYVIIASISFVVAYAIPINTGIVQGRQQFGWFAALNLLAVLVRVALTVAVVAVHGGIQGILWAGLVGTLAVYALSFVPLRDVLRASVAPLSSLKSLLGYSLGATAMVTGGLLLVNVDTLLVRHFLPGQSGYYVALTTTGRIVLFIGGSLVWVMFPKVAALHQQGRPHMSVLLWTLGGVFALSAGVVLVFAAFPNQIVAVILRAPAAIFDELPWYGLSMLFLALANVFMYYFLSLGRMAFVPILLFCCALQAALIALWHGNIAQVVAAMVVVTAVLLCGVVALYAVPGRKPGWGRG